MKFLTARGARFRISSSGRSRHRYHGRGYRQVSGDCTCKSDSPKLASSIDELSGIVLHAVKLRTENTNEIVEFLTRIEQLYGRPLAVVSDMGKGIISAVEVVFGKIDHYICHFHFLKAIGKHLFKTEENLLYKQFSKMAISGKLKILKRELEKKFSTLSLNPIEQYLKTRYRQQDENRM